MIDGFVKVAAATPEIRVADCEYNGQRIIEIVEECEEKGIKILVLPELCLTGYTCGDLFLQDALLQSAKENLEIIADQSKSKDILFAVGLPLEVEGKIYNVAAVIQNGKILGVIPKNNMPNYGEFYEARHFSQGKDIETTCILNEEEVPFGTNIIFAHNKIKDLNIAVEICEDLWVPISPSVNHVMAGATVILNLSASDELAGKDEFRRLLVQSQSAKLICGYVYADAGEGESTTDLVFAGHNIIGENGTILAESKRFSCEIISSEIDIEKISSERRKINTFHLCKKDTYKYVSYETKENNNTQITREICKNPFVLLDKTKRDLRCEDIITIQAMGLKKRLEHTHLAYAVVGVSGGLDSTLALLVTARAFDLAGIERDNIIGITMPCFGTSDRTYQNAVSLVQKLGATLLQIDIKNAVKVHFNDIGHSESTRDVTYENAQARERTQVLMDIANKYNALVIGTGDLSELALGWATYNGDHMSMYGVNSSIPKTLVRHLVSYFAARQEEELRDILVDILDTPVSPELLPPRGGTISQKTEDIVGPYELHDFFLYYIVRFGFLPSKIYDLACYAFATEYDKDTIEVWIRVFYKRFFSQQFKRSCLPDGPKVGTVTLSPRGDFRMPSDACVTVWLKDLEKINKRGR